MDQPTHLRILIAESHDYVALCDLEDSFFPAV